MRVEAVSVQFAAEVMSLEYTQLTTEPRTQDMGSRLLETLNNHAHRSTTQMRRVDHRVGERNRVIADLESRTGVTKESLEAVTRDMNKMRKEVEADRRAAVATRAVERKQCLAAERTNKQLMVVVQANILAV